mmetsp:Transcript_32747/g.76275  ORF Transcript_32747/g.76275 Transcript_32747/m.76275 type:complete len:376 (-) Transcript_32747:1340-2467(-)
MSQRRRSLTQQMIPNQIAPGPPSGQLLKLWAGKCAGPLTLGPSLGEGTFAVVYKGWDPLWRRHVAIKVLRQGNQYVDEAKLLCTLRHENVIRFAGFFRCSKGPAIVTEIASRGDLLEVQFTWPKSDRERIASVYFIQLLNGVGYMHDHGYCHRDLKLENCLVTHDGILKVADLGSAIPMGENRQIKGSLVGSVPYLAPEVLTERGKQYDGALADLWSIGVILFALLASLKPFGSEKDTLKARYKTPACVPLDAKQSVIDMIFQVDPNDRLQSTHEILKAEWCSSHLKTRNILGSLRQHKLKKITKKDSGVYKLKKHFLQMVVMVKVVRALQSPGIRGTPRDVRLVSSERLRFMLIMCEAHLQKPNPGKASKGSQG